MSQLAHYFMKTETPLPAQTRSDVVDLIFELEQRYRRRWCSLNLLADVVEEKLTQPLRAALLCGHVEDLEYLVEILGVCDLRDHYGTDYRFLRDLTARVQVLALGARDRLAQGGAPLP